MLNVAKKITPVIIRSDTPLFAQPPENKDVFQRLHKNHSSSCIPPLIQLYPICYSYLIRKNLKKTLA